MNSEQKEMRTVLRGEFVTTTTTTTTATTPTTTTNNKKHSSHTEMPKNLKLLYLKQKTHIKVNKRYKVEKHSKRNYKSVCIIHA